MKQTAVKWVFQELDNYYQMKSKFKSNKEILDQAKEMEKQQIMDAFDKAYPYDVIGYDAGGQYYKETFNNK
jgi:hypothetical protein